MQRLRQRLQHPQRAQRHEAEHAGLAPRLHEQHVDLQFEDRFRSQRAKPKPEQGSTGESTTLGMSDWVSLGGKFSTKPEVVRDSEGRPFSRWRA